MNDYNMFVEYLPILLPIIIIDIILKIIALVHIFKHDNYRIGNRLFWAVIVILISTFGSIGYFLFGKGDS